MYVIAYDDEIPDDTTEVYGEMVALLIKYPDAVGYQYMPVNEGWELCRKFVPINNEVFYHETGTWKCSNAYKTYVFPNICSTCNLKHMQGNLCLYCTRCPDCEKTNEKCYCPYYED